MISYKEFSLVESKRLTFDPDKQIKKGQMCPRGTYIIFYTQDGKLKNTAFDIMDKGTLEELIAAFKDEEGDDIYQIRVYPEG